MTPSAAALAKTLQRRVVASASQTAWTRAAASSQRRFAAVAGSVPVRALATRERCFAGAIRNAHFRGMASATASGGDMGVWEAVRIMKANDVTPEDRIDAIGSVKVDAIGSVESGVLDKLVKEQQALEIIESNAVETLLEFLKDADSTETSQLLVPSFLSLIRLSAEPLIVQELIRLEAPALLAHFLTLPEPRLQAAASLTLGNIALDPASEQAVSTPAVIDSVLHVLSSPHEAIQRAGATCLANIAGNRLARERLCETEAIFTLSELVSAEHCTCWDTVRRVGCFFYTTS